MDDDVSIDSPELERLKAFRESIETEWFQTGLKTFFWAGVVNAIFCSSGFISLLFCSRIYDQAKILRSQTAAQIETMERIEKDIKYDRERAETVATQTRQWATWMQRELTVLKERSKELKD